jgi:cell filamentation protein
MANVVSKLLDYKSPYTIDGKDESTLKNKLGITNQEELDTVERMMTSFKLAKMYTQTGAKTFDTEHLLSIHKYLFDDIYEFAGTIRNENIAKSFTFCLVHLVSQNLKYTLDQAKKKIPTIKSRDDLLKFITVLYSDLDMIHPFREGNGRTEREFIRQLIDYICERNGLEPYELNYKMIKSRDEYIAAIVKADALCQYDDLMAMFDSILVVKEKVESKSK